MRFHRAGALIRLPRCQDIVTADAMRGLSVRIAGADARPLEEGEFYLYQVIGIEARDEAGDPIGTVTDVLETGANMVLVVTPPDGGKDELFPSIPDVVIDLNPGAGYVILRRQTYWDSE